jgi:hypothetical protein
MAAIQDREHGESRLLHAEAPKNARTGEEDDDPKTSTTDASASKTPPASTLLKPTLCTRWDPGFPPPSHRRSGRQREGESANRRRRGGLTRCFQEIASDNGAGEETGPERKKPKRTQRKKINMQ